MPLHPQVSFFLEKQRFLNLKPIEQGTPEAFREKLRAGTAANDLLETVDHVENRRIETTRGPITIRIYQPAPPIPPATQEAKGAVVYYHGGGWVGGDLDTHDALCRSIANAANCTVIAIAYRLAPEHKYPIAAEDAYNSFVWVCDHHAQLNIALENIAVCGDSAGGNLAAVVSMMARDRNRPLPCIQILIYPIISHDFSTTSYQQYAEGYLLTVSGMKWFWQHYLPVEARSDEPYASPLKEKDLTGLPSALVITAEYDVLCDEGQRYASALKSSGISTQLIHYPGMIHGFMSRVALFDVAKEAVHQIACALKNSFRT